MIQLAITNLVWRPFILPMPLLAVATILVTLAVVTYVRSYRHARFVSVSMLLMRLVLIVGITIVLMGPSALPPLVERNNRPILTIMLDTSGSMQTEDIGDGSRYEFACKKWLSQSMLNHLQEYYRLELVGFDEKPRPINPELFDQPASEVATAQVTNVVHSLADVLTNQPDHGYGSAMLVLSDGRDSRNPHVQEATMIARSKSIPIHTVALGGPSLQRDLSVLAMPMQRFLFTEQPGELNVTVYQTNVSDESVSLTVTCDSKEIVRQIHFNGQPSANLKIPVTHDKPGLYVYEVAVAPVENEVEIRNNKQNLFVPVTKQRIRVLLLEGQPHWDTKFLAHALRKDDRVELTQISQISIKKRETIMTRTSEKNPEVFKSAKELAKYDVVVLGRLIENMVPDDYMAIFMEYVDQYGGQLVFARGRTYDTRTAHGRLFAKEIAVLEPVVWGQGWVKNRPIALTEVGLASPLFAFVGTETSRNITPEMMPSFTIAPVVTRAKPTAIVLAITHAPGSAGRATSKSQPSIVTMNYGRGKVLAVLGEGIWRWSMRPGDKNQAMALHDRFWSNLIRWMAIGSEFQPGQDVSLRLSHKNIKQGQSITLDVLSKTALIGHDDLKLTVVDEQGTKYHPTLVNQTARQLRLQATFTPKHTGLYYAILESPRTTPKRIESRFSVYDINFERINSQVNPAMLHALSEQTGGQFLDPHQPQILLDELKRHRAVMTVPRQAKFVWDRWSVLAFLLVWSGMEWIIRKKGGLL